MSTRCSLFTHDSPFGDVHVYQEMHDELVHVEITTKFEDGQESYGFVNLVLPDRYWQALMAALSEEGKAGCPKELPY